MVVYVCLILYLMFLSLVRFKQKQALLLSFIPIFLISAFRGISVGTDAVHYTELFQLYSNIPWRKVLDQTIEPGFVILCKIISIFSNSDIFFFIVTSFIVTYFIARIVYKNSLDISFSAFIFVTYYFFFYSFSAIRMYIAVVLIINSFYHLKRDEVKTSIIYAILATSFHYTALILLPAFVVVKLKMSKKNLTFVVISSAIFISSFQTLSYYVIMNYNRFAYYRDDISSFVGRGLSINVMLYLFVFFMIFLGIHVLNRDINFNKRNFKETINCDVIHRDIYNYLICLVISFALYIISMSMAMAARLNHYYAIMLIIYIPVITEQLSNKYKMVFKYSVIGFLFLYCILMLSHNNYQVVPYKFAY